MSFFFFFVSAISSYCLPLFLAISLNFFKYLFYIHLFSTYLLTFILTEALLLYKTLRL